MHTALWLITFSCLLPQQFDRRNHTETVATEVDDLASNRQTTRSAVSVVFSSPVSSGLVETTTQVAERWLVSEPWCIHCPAARSRFLAAGNPSDHVLTIAEAKQRHGRIINSVPAEYTTTRAVTQYQPPSYRAEWPPKWDVEGDRSPSKQRLLQHLRGGSQHAGKHWQQWTLESWSRDQLAALHSDDHEDAVPDYSQQVTATIDAEPSLDVVAETLALYLAKSTPEQPVGGLFDLTIDTPEQPRRAVADLLTKQRFELNGIAIDWGGGDRSISFGRDYVRIAPGCVIQAKRFGVTVRTTLTALRYDSDLTWVKLELSGVPDLTVRFE